jgi:hypothetical protein
MIATLLVLGCGGTEPFEASVTVDALASAPPPAHRLHVTLQVKNPRNEDVWVVFPMDPGDDFVDVSISGIRRSERRGDLEWDLEERSGASFRAYRLGPGALEAHRTELFEMGLPLDPLDVWVVRDVLIPGGTTLGGVADQLSADSALWTNPHPGFATLDEPLHRELPLVLP